MTTPASPPDLTGRTLADYADALVRSNDSALDFAGQPVPRTCENCDGLFDDSDGPEYGPPWPRCSLKPHMENLKGFPFKTPQKCFQIGWWNLVDWEAEAKALVRSTKDNEPRADERDPITED